MRATASAGPGPQRGGDVLARWIPFAFWASLLALFLIGAQVTLSLREAQGLATQRFLVRQLLLESKDLVAAVKDAELGTQGLIFTADTRYLRFYETAVTAIAAHVDAIEQLTRKTGVPQFDWPLLKQLIVTQREPHAQAVQIFLQSGQAAALAAWRSGPDLDTSQAVATAVQAQFGAVARALEDRVNSTNNRLSRALTFLAWGGTFGAAVFILGFTWLRREVHQREKAVQALAHTNRTIEAQISERTAEFEAANAALRSSEAFVRAIGDNLPGGMICQVKGDGNGRPQFVYVSAGVENLHGFTAQALMADPSLLFKQIVAEDRSAWAAATVESSRRMQVIKFDARVRLPSGEVRWRHLTSSPRRMPDGQILWDSFELDITEIKLAQAERDQMLERINDGVFSLDAQWRVTYASRRVLTVFDRTRDELLGHELWAVFPPFKRTKFFGAAHHAMATQRFQISLDFNPANDQWFECRIYPSPNGISVFATDVTTSEVAERARRESEARLSLAITAANIGLWDWQPKGNVAYLSPLLKSHIGYADDEIPNSADIWRDFVHPDDLAEVLAKSRAARHAPWPRYEHEYRLRHKDGSYRWIQATGLMLRDDADNPVRMIGTQQDITASKTTELALRTTHAQLHELLAQSHQAQEAERKRVSRQIHDELGQMLTGLKMDLRWLERKLGEVKLPTSLNALLDRAVAASELTDQAIATVQHVAAELRPTVLDHLGLVPALAQAARRFQKSAGVACTVHNLQAPAALSTEVASELFYICQEALTNVARHANASQVHIYLSASANQILLEVVDNGVGIDEAKINGRHSLGLLGMGERALYCRGSLQVQRLATGGTRVAVQVDTELSRDKATT